MAESQDPNLDNFTLEEIPERQVPRILLLDEQHTFTTKTFGFLIHPNISATFTSPTLKIADLGTGTGIWLLDVAKGLPSTCQFTGFDATALAFPPAQTLPPNVRFQVQDMLQPWPAAELGTYDLAAVRFVSVATPRAEWATAIQNIMRLLKPGGWLQWIDSCNFALYNSVAGTSRAACQEIFDGLEPFRAKDDAVIGMMMREPRNVRRQDVLRQAGLVDVHEDVFSTDRIQEPELQLRDKGTRNALTCFTGCLEGLIGVEGSKWTKEKIKTLEAAAMKEVDQGVYHTLDQVCIVGRKPL